MKASMFRVVLRKYWKLLLSVLIVSALGCGIMTGLTSSYLSMERSFAGYVREYACPDAVIGTEVTTTDQAERLYEVPGVTEVTTRLAGDTIMRSPSGRYLSVRAFSYTDQDFQQFYYWQRAEAGEGDPVLLEYKFAGDNGIEAGDTIQVRVEEEYRTCYVAALLTIGTGQVVTLLGTSIISSIQPSEAMSRPVSPFVVLSCPLRWLTGKVSPLVKFSILSMLRNKGRFAFSVVCLAASVMMIFASFSFMTSKNQILTELFDQRIRYDCQVFFDGQPKKELLEKLQQQPYVSEIIEKGYYSSEISFDGRTESASVNSVPEDTDMIRVFDVDSNPLAIPHEGIILEKHLAQKLGAGVGDTVRVDGVDMKVTAISGQSMGWSQYISLHQAQSMVEPTLHALVIRSDTADAGISAVSTAAEAGAGDRAEAEEQGVLAVLTDEDDYLYCIFTRIFMASNVRTFTLYDTAAWILIAFAVLIGFVIVQNTSRTNLLEQKKELCVLRTLGFQHRTISRNWFSQSALHFICSCIVGFPCGMIIAKYALRRLAVEGREYPYASGPSEFLMTGALVFAFVVVSHIISMHSMKGWDIVENVKDKE